MKFIKGLNNIFWELINWTMIIIFSIIFLLFFTFILCIIFVIIIMVFVICICMILFETVKEVINIFKKRG